MSVVMGEGETAEQLRHDLIIAEMERTTAWTANDTLRTSLRTAQRERDTAFIKAGGWDEISRCVLGWAPFEDLTQEERIDKIRDIVVEVSNKLNLAVARSHPDQGGL